METLLIVGVETAAGYQLLSHDRSEQRTLGTTIARRAAHADHRVCQLAEPSIAAARNLLQHEGVTRMVYAGEASESCWFSSAIPCSDDAALSLWTAAAREAGIPFTFVSSDAVFTGPWMSHNEDSQHFCDSNRADSIRRQEAAVLDRLPEALVVRTHVIGWTPGGWLDQWIRAAQAGEARDLDTVRHATPLWAGLFAGLLDRVHETGASGLLHLAGSERTNPYLFLLGVSDRLGWTAPRPRSAGVLSERPQGFGQGETSLQTSRARGLLQSGLPNVADSIDALADFVSAHLADGGVPSQGSPLSHVA